MPCTPSQVEKLRKYSAYPTTAPSASATSAYTAGCGPNRATPELVGRDLDLIGRSLVGGEIDDQLVDLLDVGFARFPYGVVHRSDPRQMADGRLRIPSLPPAMTRDEPGSVRAAGARVRHVLDLDVGDRVPGTRGVDDLALAGVDPDVADPGVEEDQIALRRLDFLTFLPTRN